MEAVSCKNIWSKPINVQNNQNVKTLKKSNMVKLMETVLGHMRGCNHGANILKPFLYKMKSDKDFIVAACNI